MHATSILIFILVTIPEEEFVLVGTSHIVPRFFDHHWTSLPLIYQLQNWAHIYNFAECPAYLRIITVLANQHSAPQKGKSKTPPTSYIKRAQFQHSSGRELDFSSSESIRFIQLSESDTVGVHRDSTSEEWVIRLWFDSFTSKDIHHCGVLDSGAVELITHFPKEYY